MSQDDMQKKINRCKHCHMEIRKPFPRKCCKDERDTRKAPTVTETDCENCRDFESRYIEYPITVQGIEYVPRNDYNLEKPGLVRIRPCDEKYGNKTYLGLLLGELPVSTYVTYNKNDEKLTVGMMNNPAIFIFETKEVVYGYESWWQKIEDPSELNDITDETINSQWYVALLKGMSEKAETPKDN